jgi:hypothetical protein
MSNNYTFRPAIRTEAKPLIGLYSESGGGKTYSALLLAKGFATNMSKVGMIETESGRGEVYAEDPIVGGYQVLPIRDDYSPVNYGNAIDAAGKAGLEVLIIDSASHEWEGSGGVLSMAAANQESGKKGPLVWQVPKLSHSRHFMLKLLGTPVPLVIVCMRAKYPMREEKRSNGGKEWVRSDVLEPKQADDILFEMMVHGWLDKEHKFHLTNCTEKGLKQVFLDNQQITIETGKRLVDWAKGGIAKPESVEPEAPLCSDCGQPITGATLGGKHYTASQIVDLSLSRFNASLCVTCSAKRSAKPTTDDGQKEME